MNIYDRLESLILEGSTQDSMKKMISFLFQRQKDTSKALYYDRKSSAPKMTKTASASMVKDKNRRKPRIATAFDIYKQNKHANSSKKD